MPTLNLNDRANFPLRNVARRGYVWTKAAWADQWTPRPDLYPTQAVWGTFPGNPSTASLHYKYGWTILPGANRPANYTRITARGYWVLILFTGDDGQLLSWCGYAESPITNSHSPVTSSNPETGTQTIPCFGLERIWDYAFIDSTVATDPDNAGYHRRHIGTCPAFNADIAGNRSAAVGKLNDDRPYESYAFAQPLATDRKAWSSRHIVEHLLAYHAPTPARILPDTAAAAGDDEIPWAISGLASLPDWDAPTLYVEGSTVAAMLSVLVDARRMNMGSIAAEVTFEGESIETAVPTVTAVRIKFATTLPASITVPDVATIPANPAQLTINAIDDPHTRIDDTMDGVDLVDQVVVRGPREIAIGTFSYGEELTADWSGAEQNEYDNGGLGTAGWGTLENETRRAINVKVRSQAKLTKVYQWYKLVDDWDGTVGGERLYPLADPNAAAATDKDGDLPNHIPFAGSHEMLPELPLLPGVDYSGDYTESTESSATELNRGIPHVISLRHPTGEATKRDVIEGIGEIALGLKPDTVQMIPTRIAAAPPPPHGGCGVRLNITGHSRLAIAGDHDVGNEADGKGLGVYNFATLQATIACLGDRRPSWSIPTDAELTTLDVIRRRVFTFDWPSLDLIHIAKDTVVSIDETGEAIKSNGGVVRDPLPRLRAIAELIARHSNRPRHRVSIRTTRRLGSAMPGTLLVATDTVSGALDAPITEVRIDAPLGDSGESEISQTITAATYAADVLGLLQNGRRR